MGMGSGKTWPSGSARWPEASSITLGPCQPLPHAPSSPLLCWTPASWREMKATRHPWRAGQNSHTVRVVKCRINT